MKIKKSDLFYIGISAGTLYTILDFLKWDMSILVQILKILCIACFITKIFLDSYKLKTLVIFAMISLLALYTASVSGEAYIFVECLLVMSMKNIDFEKAIFYIFRVRQIILYICLVAFIISFLFNPDKVGYINSRNETRYYLMFTHPNNAAMFWLWHLMEYAYVFFDKMKKKNYVYIVGAGFLIWSLTKSDVFLFSILLLLMFMLMKRVNLINKLLRILSKYGFGAATVVFILLLFLRNTYFYKILDALTTGRLEMNAKAYKYFGFSLLGQEYMSSNWVEYGGNVLGYMVLDNFYMRTLIQIGVFYMLLIILGTYLYAKCFSYKQMVCIVILMFYAVAEHYAGNVFIAFPLLIVGYYAMNKR